MLWDSLADLAGNAVANVSISANINREGCTRYLGGTLKVTFTATATANQSTSTSTNSNNNTVASSVVEPYPTFVCPLRLPPGAEVLAVAEVVSTTGSAAPDARSSSRRRDARTNRDGSTTPSSSTPPSTFPVAFRLPNMNGNGGSLTVYLFGNYGVTDVAINVPKPCQVDVQTKTPMPLSASINHLLATAMSAQALFDFSVDTADNGYGGGSSEDAVGAAGNGASKLFGKTNLSWVPKQVSPTEYLVGVSNTKLDQQPLAIKSNIGAIVSITDVPLNDAEKSTNNASN